MFLDFWSLADLTVVPSKTIIGGPPFLLMVIGLIIWYVGFDRRKKLEPNPIITGFGYFVVAISGLFSYFYNHQYFNPAVLNAPNYWNNQAKTVLYLSVYFPPVLAIILAIIDIWKAKEILREEEI